MKSADDIREFPKVGVPFFVLGGPNNKDDSILGL